MSNPVGWFEIYVQDMARAEAFYSTVFGAPLEVLDNPELDMRVFSMDRNCYGVAGALVKMPGVPSGGNSVLVYFHCEDCAVEAEKAAQAGGQIHRGKMSIGPHGFIALVIDTEGNLIGLHSMQ
jgi:predicted enzyme related to lactoylglutathione lyase